MLWTIIIIVGFIVFYEVYWKRRHYPPGPMPLPIFGNYLSISWDYPGHSAYQRWKEQFGPIYTYWLGWNAIVTVNDYKLIQEMFILDGDNYADRSSNIMIHEAYRGGKFGVIETSGELWKEQRRFTLHSLKNLGVGKEQIEEKILSEMLSLFDRMEKDCLEHTSTSPYAQFERSVTSVINMILFGYSFDQHTESEYYDFKQRLEDHTEHFSSPILLIHNAFPTIAQYLPYFKQRVEYMERKRDAVFQLFRRNMVNHLNTIDYENEESYDFCEAYLKEMSKQNDSNQNHFSDRQFYNVCIDLWMAGVDTTVATMSWGLCLLINYPHVQELLHREYDQVIGCERLITMKDKINLPYTNAFINEVQRWSNIVPQNLLRKTSRDVRVGGYDIKKGSLICPQVSVLLFDPEIFPDPYTFKPERFIDENGKLKMIKQFIPFSVGRRQCLGEGLARMELFLFFSNIVHRYHISAVDPSRPPSLRRIFKSVGQPEPFDCIITRRSI